MTGAKEGFSWFKQESGARPSGGAGQLSGQFRLEWALCPARQPVRGRNAEKCDICLPATSPPLLLLVQLLRRRKETCIFPLLLCTRQVHQSQLSSSSSPLKLVYIPPYRRGRADSRAKGGVEPVLLFTWHRKVLAGPVTKSLAASGLS